MSSIRIVRIIGAAIWLSGPALFLWLVFTVAGYNDFSFWLTFPVLLFYCIYKALQELVLDRPWMHPRRILFAAITLTSTGIMIPVAFRYLGYRDLDSHHRAGFWVISTLYVMASLFKAHDFLFSDFSNRRWF